MVRDGGRAQAVPVALVMGLVAVLGAGPAMAGAPPEQIFTDGFEQGDAAPWSAGPITEVNVFYSGHSLVNLDLPRLLEQLALAAGRDHRYNLQVGNGSTMAWRLETPENGQNRDGVSPLGFSILSEIPDAQTIAGEKYDAVVVTEAVPLFDHLLYSQTITSARSFFDLALASPAGERPFLYEVWPAVEAGDFSAWRERVVADRALWDCVVARVNDDPRAAARPMRLLPGGAALAELVAAVAAGAVPGLATPDLLFVDDIHLSNQGNYFMALVHAATLYRQPLVDPATTVTNPWGVPYPELPSAATAAAMATIAWEAAQTHAQQLLPSYDQAACFELLRSRCNGSAWCEGVLLDALAQ